MREFIYYSGKARTSGNFDDLMKAGRIDIACHMIINAFFVSQKMRDDVKLHLVFYGPPDPPKHLEMFPGKAIPETGVEAGKEQLDISKKDMANLIKKMLYKYKKNKKIEVWNGFWIEKKSLFKVIEELEEQGKTIYVLDRKGEDISKVEIAENPVFVIGDNEGFPNKELKKLKKVCKSISVGKQTYFASQIATIINYELDKRKEQ